MDGAAGPCLGALGAARRGFTMVELLVVLVLLAVTAGMASFALRDGDDDRLAREAARLSALLESGRAESRASGAVVRFKLVGEAGSAFDFPGLDDRLKPGTAWLHPGVTARLEGNPGGEFALGPEPLIGAQQLVLRLGDREARVATDGLGPFGVLGMTP